MPTIEENRVAPKFPVRTRFPVNICTLAQRIANKNNSSEKLEPWERYVFQQLAVKCGTRTATEDEQNAFYYGTVRLLRQMSTGFQKRNPAWYGCDDLIQSCFSRVWETLPGYKPDEGALSTWIFYVCNSVLCKEYNSCKVYNSRMYFPDNSADDDEGTGASRGVEKYGSFNEDNMLKMRVRDAVVDIFEKYEDKADILLECFGNPFAGEYEPPTTLPSRSELARNIKHPYSEVYQFFRDVIKPHFEKLFSDFA